MNDSAFRHQRQLILAPLGPEGQRELSAARVLVVGCGGLGSPVIQYLAAAGVGRLVLADDDVVELSNLNRQTLHRTKDVGRSKATRAAEWVAELDPSLEVTADERRLSLRDARERVRGFSLVVDCTDGLPGKFLLNDACVLENVPLVHGAATGLSGQVLVVPGREGPCLRCLFEELPDEGAVPSCQQAGVLGATTGVVGSLMALEAVKWLAMRSLVTRAFLSVNLGDVQLRRVAIQKLADCAACGEKPRVDGRTAEDYAPACFG